MRLGLAGLYRARWTTDISEEWVRNVNKKNPHISRDKLEKVSAKMNYAILDALIENYSYLISKLSLPDPNDRHVLAAAIHGKVDLIITFDLKDFPEKPLAPYRLRSVHPDEFLCDIFDMSPTKVLATLRTMREKRNRPALSARDFIEKLKRQGLPKFYSLVSPYTQLI